MTTNADDERPSTPAQTFGPMVGLRVLDIGQLIAGPMAASLLADWGADVVKVEEPESGDSIRRLAPHKDGISLWWKVNGRNKRCTALNLKDRDDRETFYSLVKAADVVIENYSVGTTADLGINYDKLKEINPGIIMLSVSGFGQTGPYSNKRGFGRVAEAFSGMAYVTGHPDRPPVHAGFPVADYVSGVLGAAAVLAAVYERDHNSTHEGQYIDLGLFEAPFRLMEFIAIAYDQLGVIAERRGDQPGYVSPVGTWKAKDGGYASFTGSTQETVLRLFDAIGRPDLKTDERFADNTSRLANHDELDKIISEWIAERPLAEVIEILDQYDVAIAPYLNIKDIFENPHYAAREDLVSTPDDDLGMVRTQNVIPKFSRTPGSVRHLGRTRIGDDQEEVLLDWLRQPI